MHRVFSIGPIETDQGEGYMLTLTDGARPIGVESAPVALDALRKLVERLGADTIIASPELGDEARSLGVRVAPLSESLSMLRATQALLLANGGSIPPEFGDEAAWLVKTICDYVEAAPWRWLDGDTPLLVYYEQGDGRPKVLEASVLGNADVLVGLALYDRPGSIAKLGRGRSKADEVVLLTLDDEPRWAVEAMRAGFGLPFFPNVARVRRDEPGPLREGDLRRLEAVLLAISRLQPDESAVEGSYEDEHGRQVLVRVELARSAPRRTKTKVSRNAPCPCGSGRKYKRCCLSKDQAQARQPTRGSTRPAQTETLTDKLISFMAREHPDHARRWSEALLGRSKAPQELVSVIMPMLLFELPLATGETVGRRFMARHGRRLDADERRSLEASCAASFSIWEVLRVELGHGLELVDLLTGERCFVHEVSGTRNMQVRASLMTRVTTSGERRLLDGLYPVPLPPACVDEVVAGMRRRLGVRKQWIDRALLRDPTVTQALFELWHGRVELERERPEEPIEIINTDGDPAEDVCDRYTLLDEPESMLAQLLEIPDTVDRGLDDEGAHVVDVVRKGNAMHRAWMHTNVGQLELRGSTLRLTTNSRARADALRAAVEARLGLFARFVGREVEAYEARYKPGGGRVAIDSQPVCDWMRPLPTMLHALQFRFWRHEPHERLDGQTPCQAVARAPSRRKLHALLRELEHGADEDAQAALAQLRKELGLDEIGGRLRGAAKPYMEVKISWRLMELAMPLLMVSEDEEQGEAILRVATEVWNLVGESGVDAVDRVALIYNARAALSAHELEVDDAQLKAWIDSLVPLRALYEDPRLAKIIAVERSGGMFNCSAAALSPR